MRSRTLILALAAAFGLWLVAGAAAQNTQNLQITKGPVLEMVADTSAVIAWSTNVPGSTVLRYGTNPNNLSQTAEAPWGGTTHRVTLRNLQPSTRYYFQLQSGQAQGSGSGALSKIDSFQTVPQVAQPQHYAPVQ
jgi:phosphodiesterase/alkaline phosphatase D-like protein